MMSLNSQLRLLRLSKKRAEIRNRKNDGTRTARRETGNLEYASLHTRCRLNYRLCSMLVK
jgi:hypothetical protein